MISAAVQVLYHQSTQLFPGNDDTVPNLVKLAIDPEAGDSCCWEHTDLGALLQDLELL